MGEGGCEAWVIVFQSAENGKVKEYKPVRGYPSEMGKHFVTDCNQAYPKREVPALLVMTTNIQFYLGG
jgi:hypothetical protein